MTRSSKENVWKHGEVKKSSICGDKKLRGETYVFMALFSVVQTTGLEIFQNLD